MKLLKSTIALSLTLLLASCAITPEQKAEREAKRVRAEQALQVKLAKQCDLETAELIHEQFNPPLSRTPKEQADFEKRYAEKVNNPVFQACYKLALENYKAQEELEYMRMHYDDMRFGFGFGRFCYACW
ncbi:MULTISPECIES: hypothetical protein [Glaesserella]|uniref:Lipoprotein n=1 Tax=Glaesserella australis TaxID=2094024 RepID=A0A328BZ78_9PAST|nr:MULTISPECIES: hypothetical protein [Glaesserella]AUI65453.1 hypothetical protein CJD39_02145 [Glaesserella sp. 15-184]RAL19648.1 hypothetical protein C5N92_01230 [Glaesserella australis]